MNTPSLLSSLPAELHIEILIRAILPTNSSTIESLKGRYITVDYKTAIACQRTCTAFSNYVSTICTDFKIPLFQRIIQTRTFITPLLNDAYARESCIKKQAKDWHANNELMKNSRQYIRTLAVDTDLTLDYSSIDTTKVIPNFTEAPLQLLTHQFYDWPGETHLDALYILKSNYILLLKIFIQNLENPETSIPLNQLEPLDDYLRLMKNHLTKHNAQNKSRIVNIQFCWAQANIYSKIAPYILSEILLNKRNNEETNNLNWLSDSINMTQGIFLDTIEILKKYKEYIQTLPQSASSENTSLLSIEQIDDKISNLNTILEKLNKLLSTDDNPNAPTNDNQ